MASTRAPTVTGTAVPATTAAPATPSATAATLPSTAGQTQYQIIKVRKPDGTIIKVRRPVAATSRPNDASKTFTRQDSSPATVSDGAPKNTIPTEASAAPVSSANKVNATVQVRPSALPTSASGLSPTNNGQQNVQRTVPTQPTNQTPVTKTATPVAAVSTSAEPAKVAAAAASPQSKPDVKHEQGPAATHAPSTHPVSRPSRFGGLKMAGARLALAFAPSIPMDIGDLEAGDISMSDDDDDMDMSDDEHYDSDHGDLDHNDNDHEDDNDHDVDQQGHDTSAGNHGVEHNGNGDQHNAASSHHAKAFETALKSTARGLVVPSKPRQTVSAEKKNPVTDGKGPTVMDEKMEKGPIVSEKEVPESLEEPVTPISSRARNLARRSAEWSRYVIWALMIMFPGLFMILAVITGSLQGKPMYDTYYGPLGDGVKQALIIGTTLWPIVFAAVIAQSLRAFATWKVERGVKLMTLEQLVNSNSVAAAVKSPFLLRRIDLVTVGLLLTWALSPLASQAMQRMLSTGGSSAAMTIQNAYLNTTGPNVAFSSSISQDLRNQVDVQIIGRLFNAIFLPEKAQVDDSTQSSIPTTDLFGQPLIPKCGQTLQSGLSPDKDGFVTISTPGQTSVDDYTSYYGLPLEYSGTGVPSTYWNNPAYAFFSTTRNFVTQVSILEVDCLQPVQKTWTQLQADLPNITFSSTFSDSLLMNIESYNSTSPGTIYFASAITDYNSTTSPGYNSTCAYTTCSINQAFYDTGLNCTNDVCQVNKVRKTINPPPASPLYEGFCEDFLGAITTYVDDTNTIVESKLGGFYEPTNSSSNSHLNLTGADVTTFNNYMSFMLNTYWQLGFTTTDRYGIDPNMTTSPIARATASLKGSYNNYEVSWGWFVALLICACSMLCAAISSVIFDSQSIAPDMLGFVSSVARRNKYVDLPKVDSTMSGAERARLLGEVRVMMQDVKPRADVGRIALGTAHASAKRLQQGRLYQ